MVVLLEKNDVRIELASRIRGMSRMVVVGAHAVLAVAVAEGHPAVLDSQQALVADGDPMGEAA
jgi:hypothetical protein